MIKKLYFGLVLIPVLSSVSGNKGVDCQTVCCEEKLLVSQKTSNNNFSFNVDFLKQTTTTDLLEEEIVPDTFYSPRWRGWWGIEYELECHIKECYKIEGVYAIDHPLISRNLLESGDYQSKYSYKYNSSNHFKESAYYSDEVTEENELKFKETFTSHSDAFGTFDGSTSLEYRGNYSVGSKYNLNYSRVKKDGIVYEVNVKMDSSTAKYCPVGYNIGIGRIGTYYVISFEYQRFSFACGNRRPDSEKMSNTIVFANESIMAESFIYTKGASDILYY
jgi:hypothetical protein